MNADILGGTIVSVRYLLPLMKQASAIWRHDNEGGTLVRDLIIWIRFLPITVKLSTVWDFPNKGFLAPTPPPKVCENKILIF